MLNFVQIARLIVELRPVEQDMGLLFGVLPTRHDLKTVRELLLELSATPHRERNSGKWLGGG